MFWDIKYKNLEHLLDRIIEQRPEKDHVLILSLKCEL